VSAPRLLVGLVAALIAGPGTAQAASFDCAKAATAREKLICADPKLSAMDDALAKSYRAALQPLSPDGRTQLRNGQRAWLRFADTLCGTGGSQIPPAANRFDTPTACLHTRYTVRQRQLDHATTAVAGGLVIARLEDFAATPSSDSNKFVERDIAFPQIDRPGSDAERRWNVAVRERAAAEAMTPPTAENPRMDVWLDYSVKWATPALISVVFDLSWYGHGAAHPSSGSTAFNWLLADRRALAPADLFDRAKPWRDTLARLAFVQLQGHVAANELFVKSAAQLVDIAADPRRWAIEPDGLHILFGQYEVGPYVLGQPEALLSWSALAPVLAAHPAFAIPPG